MLMCLKCIKHIKLDRGKINYSINYCHKDTNLYIYIYIYIISYTILYIITETKRKLIPTIKEVLPCRKSIYLKFSHV